MFLTSSSMSFFRSNAASTNTGTNSDIRSAYSDDECDYSAATSASAAMHESTGPLKPHRAQQLLLQHRFQATSHSLHDHHRPQHHQHAVTNSRTASNGSSSSNSNNNRNGDRIESLPLKQHQDQQILLKQQLFKSFIPNHLRRQQQPNQQEASQQEDHDNHNHPLTYYSSSTHSAPGRMNQGIRRGRCDSYDSCDSSFGCNSSVMTKESDDDYSIDNNNNNLPSTTSSQQQQNQHEQQKPAPTTITTTTHNNNNGVRSRSISPIRSNHNTTNNKRFDAHTKNDNNNNNNSSDVKMKFAHEILLVSIAAVIDFLKVSGIPKPRYVLSFL